MRTVGAWPRPTPRLESTARDGTTDRRLHCGTPQTIFVVLRLADAKSHLFGLRQVNKVGLLSFRIFQSSGPFARLGYPFIPHCSVSHP